MFSRIQQWRLSFSSWIERNPDFWPLAVLFGTWGVFFTSIFSRMARFTPLGFVVGHVNVWSDWSLHIGMINIFAIKPPALWFAYHPMYASGKFTYGFLTNLISGMLVRLGWSLPLALIMPSIICIFIFMICAYFLLSQLLESRWASIVALTLFFLSAGLGGWRFIADLQKTPTWENVMYPPELYSRFDEYEWYSGNVIVGMLAPQRAFLLGITLATASYLCFTTGALRERRLEKPGLVALGIFGGVLAGVLPITHMHSFLVLILLCAPITLITFKENWRFLVTFAGTAAVISLPLYVLFIAGGIENPDFFQLLLGWTAEGDLWSWIQQWVWQWGVVLPLALIGSVLAWKKVGWERAIILTSFWLPFLVANVVLLQPIRWDNAKFFLYSYLGLSALVALVLEELWSRRWYSKILVGVTIILLTFTGVLELTRYVQIKKNELYTTSMDDIELGLQIRNETDPLAVFLTTPAHNHFVMMWGARPVVMGYSAWVWNFGFLYDETYQDIRAMYKVDEKFDELVRKHNISYVVVGPGEMYDLQANDEPLAARFPVAFFNRSYRVYDVRELLKSNVD